MIIGQFCDTYPPSLDGVGRVALSYCQTLTAMGHDTYYIAPESPEADEVSGFKTLLSASVKMPHEMYRIGLPALDPAYKKKVNQVPFDIVHAHSPFLAAEEAQRIAKRRDIPLVSSFHSKYYDDALAKTHSVQLARFFVHSIVRFYEKCDGVWTVNNATAEVLRSYGFTGEILVMENGTNREELNPAADKHLSDLLGPKDKVPTLLFVGQHNYKKNLHGILGACAILKAQGQPFRLLTAGNGPDFQDIVEEARTLGIAEECRFLGFIGERPLLMALYHRADLLVFPSIYDNAPMVLREAAVMGTPGLVVRGSCSAEGVEDGVNGFISPDEQAGSIARTIIRALPDTVPVGENASRTIPISWEIIMRRVVAEYERLITGRRVLN